MRGRLGLLQVNKEMDAGHWRESGSSAKISVECGWKPGDWGKPAENCMWPKPRCKQPQLPEPRTLCSEAVCISVSSPSMSYQQELGNLNSNGAEHAGRDLTHFCTSDEENSFNRYQPKSSCCFPWKSILHEKMCASWTWLQTRGKNSQTCCVLGWKLVTTKGF